MIDDCEVNEYEQIEAATADKIAVITGISFPNKKANDTVCVHFTYWDADHGELRKSCTDYSSIYTYRKNLFQQFCEEFELIEDGYLNPANALNCICLTEYHPVYGIIKTPSGIVNRTACLLESGIRKTQTI